LVLKVALLIGVVVALVGAWLALVIALVVARPDGATTTDALTALPDTVRLVRRLATDPDPPPSVRTYSCGCSASISRSPDLIPDFIPVLGYADDAIVAAVALRQVVRVAGPQALDQHWSGSPARLLIVRRLAGLSPTAG
jgi:hypothetical protein